MQVSALQADQIAGALQTAGTPSGFAGLQAQKSALVAGTLANVRQVLTADGVSKIDQYVQTRVKARMMIYGGTPH